MIRAELIIAEQLANLGRCKKAIYSLSPCTPDTHVVQFMIATETEIASYMKPGAIGIIAGRFIDRVGPAVLGPLDNRLIGADHATLAAVNGLLVVYGLHKAEATLAALHGDFVNHLISDLTLAEVLPAHAAWIKRCVGVLKYNLNPRSQRPHLRLGHQQDVVAIQKNAPATTVGSGCSVLMTPWLWPMVSMPRRQVVHS